MESLLDALAVLLPVECLGCGADDRALCRACRAALVPEVSSRLLRDGLRVWSGLEYDGVARVAMLALKKDGRLDAARALAPALAAAVVAAGASLGEERREATRLEPATPADKYIPDWAIILLDKMVEKLNAGGAVRDVVVLKPEHAKPAVKAV